MTDPTEHDPTLPSSYPEPYLGGGLDPAKQLAAEELASVETEEGNPEAEDDSTEGDDESDYAAIAATYTAERDYGSRRTSAGGDQPVNRGDSAIGPERGARERAGGRQTFAPAGPTPSETAVHVSDPASAVFVVVVVVAFIAIFAYGMLGGVGGLFTPIPTPAPLPSVAPSTGPSSGPSVEPSGGSAAPSASVGPSPSSAAPSVSPSPSSAPSPATSPSPSS